MQQNSGGKSRSMYRVYIGLIYCAVPDMMASPNEIEFKEQIGKECLGLFIEGYIKEKRLQSRK